MEGNWGGSCGSGKIEERSFVAVLLWMTAKGGWSVGENVGGLFDRWQEERNRREVPRRAKVRPSVRMTRETEANSKTREIQQRSKFKDETFNDAAAGIFECVAPAALDQRMVRAACQRRRQSRRTPKVLGAPSFAVVLFVVVEAAGFDVDELEGGQVSFWSDAYDVLFFFCAGL
jgi:hypothetical protein